MLLQDLRYAARQLRKSPGFTGLVVLTISLGIGANTAMFSVLNGFLRPLPVPDPDRIVVLAEQNPNDEAGMGFRFSYPALTDLRHQTSGFSDIFASNTLLGGLNVNGKITQFVYSAVTGNFFTGLGLRPAAGRVFLPGEGERSGSELIVVLGYSCWQKRFGGDPGAIGRQVRIDGATARVIGVVPKEFYGCPIGSGGGWISPAELSHAIRSEGRQSLHYARPASVGGAWTAQAGRQHGAGPRFG